VDPELPQRAQGLAQRVGGAIGIGGQPEQPQQQPPPEQQPAAAAPQAQQAEADPKPSPMPQQSEANAPPLAPLESLPATASPSDTPRNVAARAVAQSLTLTSLPAGAVVQLDGREEATCITPCSLTATPGRHSLAFTLPGYLTSRRDITVGNAPLEVPVVSMQAPTGSLMLTTVPDGASISVNGRKIAQTTPASVSLTPGNYSITVEKGGRQATSPVEIRTGAISYLRIVLEP
jgi:hypothetical protein